MNAWGNNDQTHSLCIVKSKASSCLKLSLINGHDTGTDDFRNVCTGVDTKRQASYQDFIDADRSEHNEVHDQQLDDGRGTADDSQINSADRICNLEVPGFVMGGTDDRNKKTDADTNEKGKYSDDHGVFQTIQKPSISVIFL